ncbi:hypothetical protein BD413DRAFT_596358 [Trametes elegans]|nr:hypothetical protein BD413DRAFT_596358 [Trametes elegans]
MASPTTTPLAERAEIHKSCKTLESVVNILNDYCEAANAIVQLQKKLAKALREAAASKCVSDIPANALNATATIFEAMSEVDAKFAKYVDKECDNVSGEVKKWFKKLAKEERTHDEKIASANQKIKQAGLIYERKAKKSPRDAADEHTRYINLLSTLGPEVNREKYNHAMLVTQRHSSTMYNLAASFSRVADAEWMRGCESVRRYSPSVGTLGQWRALCEGGWAGAMPPDLPDTNDPNGPPDASPHPPGTKDNDYARPTETRELAPPSADRAAPQYSSRNASEQSSSRAVTPGQSPVPPPQYFPPTQPSEQPSADGHSFQGSTHDPDQGKSDGDREERKNHSTTLASLAAFPAPPTHFPLPPLGSSRFTSSPASTPTHEGHVELPREHENSSAHTPFPRLTESPTPENATTPALTEDSRSPPTPRTELFTPPLATPASPAGESPNNKRDPPAFAVEKSGRAPEAPITPTTSSHSASTLPSQEYAQTGKRPSLNEPASGPPKRGDHMDDAEFGVRRSTEYARPRASEPSLPKVVERSDTGKSNGSVVAALRDRYARGGAPSSPPPRDLPRLPNSVSSLAHRYEPTAGSSNGSRQATGSPTQERARVGIDNYARMPEPASASATRYSSVPPTPTTEEIALRRQRIEELEELELREREHELRMKEREIESRAREIERERQQILTARGGRNDGYASDSSRGAVGARTSTTQRPTVHTLPGSRYPSSYSQSATNLVPPSSAQVLSSRQPSSQPSTPIAQPEDHAPYCGCESCSASKYKSRDAFPRRDSRPTEPPPHLRPEKPKGGWIRRLSMPVVSNAFSLDSKKNASNVGIAGGHGHGHGYRNSLAFTEEDGRLHTDVTGGIRNRSSTNLARR